MHHNQKGGYQCAHVSYIFCKTILLCLIIIACALGILLFPNDVRNGASNGISYCLYTLVPSLFPFMVLSSFIIHSGISKFIGKLLQPVIQFLFYLPGSAGSVIIMSMIGGYPVGARGCMSLLEQGAITQKQAQRMLYFLRQCRTCLYYQCSRQYIAAKCTDGTLLFFLSNCSHAGHRYYPWHYRTIQKRTLSYCSIFRTFFPIPLVESTLDAAKGLMNMSAFVIIFSAFFVFAACNRNCSRNLPITAAVAHACTHRSLHRFIANRNHQRMCRYRLPNAPIALVAFGLGFGGFCVHFSNLCSYLKVWNFQIEIYCVPVHPRNHSRTGNHVISSSVSTACSLCFSKYFRTNIRHDFLFMACRNCVSSLLCFFLCFLSDWNAENQKQKGRKNKKQ